MKKFTKTIASISLLLFAIGVMAQTQSNGKTIKNQGEIVNTNPVVIASPSADSKGVTSNSTEAYISYVGGDSAYVKNGTTGIWTEWVIDPINYYYTINDTAPNLSLPDYNTLNSVTVAFDSLYDDITEAGYIAKPGSVTLNTISMEYTYNNVSGNNDTLIFWICEVDAQGFPTNHVISSDTIFFTPADSHPDINYIYTLPLANPVTIPSTARQGWNFCITADYRNASKTDTFGIEHYSSSTTCTAPGNTGTFCNAETVMGVPCGPLTACNSWALGWYRYNDTVFGGNGDGASLFWPDTTGALTGYRINNGGDTIRRAPCPGDTFLYSNKQDIAIAAIVTFDNTTGINNISASGLSIGQNYPNPFNKQTQITYSLTNSSNVVFNVYDITGRVIMTNDYGEVSPGQYEINLSANSFSPGIYFYTFNVNGSTITKKMVVTE